MNKTELIKAVVDKSGVSKKDVEAVINAEHSVIVDALVDKQQIQITGFGTFKTVHKNATTATNPKTKEPVEVPEKDVPKFVFSKNVKDLVK